MSNWDDDDWEADTGPGLPMYPHAAPADNWDDEDESEDETLETNLKKPSAPMKPSKQRALALKQKEEEENRKAAERIRALEQKMQEMSAIERKMEQQRRVEEADLQNAKDMFMVSDTKDEMAPPAQPTLDNFKPVTDADFKKFADMLAERCRILNDNPRKTTRYVTFLKDLIRGVTAELGPDDAKDLSTFMGIISNEKRDEFKKSKGFKKKVNKKASVRVDKAADMRDDRYDDFVDDFM